MIGAERKHFSVVRLFFVAYCAGAACCVFGLLVFFMLNSPGSNDRGSLLAEKILGIVSSLSFYLMIIGAIADGASKFLRTCMLFRAFVVAMVVTLFVSMLLW